MSPVFLIFFMHVTFSTPKYSMQTMYFMVEKCFGTCVETFRRKSLDTAEERVSDIIPFMLGSNE